MRLIATAALALLPLCASAEDLAPSPDWYSQHPSELREALIACNNGAGDLRNDPVCNIARQGLYILAVRLAMDHIDQKMQAAGAQLEAEWRRDPDKLRGWMDMCAHRVPQDPATQQVWRCPEAFALQSMIQQGR